MDELLQEFLIETKENLDALDVSLLELMQNPQDAEALNTIFRLLHMIKGSCGLMKLPRLGRLSHAAEGLLDKLRDRELQITETAIAVIFKCVDRLRIITDALERNNAEHAGDDGDIIDDIHALAQELPLAFMAPHHTMLSKPIFKDTIRVNVDLLDDLVTKVSELVLARNQLQQLLQPNSSGEKKLVFQQLNNLVADLHNTVMKTRMVPISRVWAKLPRLIHDLSAILNKKLSLKMLNGEIELDRHIAEIIQDPLVHLIRNSADHGIEMPATRQNAGKSPIGTITLEAHHEGGYIIITIADDGQGIDTVKLRQKLQDQNILPTSHLSQLSDQQLLPYIFYPGFSTAATVNEISGRGVGLDIVKSNLEKIGGAVDVASSIGLGTIFTLKIPITLAVMPSLVIGVGDLRFAIPQASIKKVIDITMHPDAEIRYLQDQMVLQLRGDLCPLFRLDILCDCPGAPDIGIILILEVGKYIFGLATGHIYYQEEIAVKPLPSILNGANIYAGCTILTDGGAALILDPMGLYNLATQSQGRRMVADFAILPPAPVIENQPSFIIFKTGDGAQKALNLDCVRRIKDMRLDDIEIADDKPVTHYQNRLLPLIMMRGANFNDAKAFYPVIIFRASDTQGEAGLLVNEIIDIVVDDLDVQLPAQSPHLAGTAMLNNQTTDIINISHLVAAQVRQL